MLEWALDGGNLQIRSIPRVIVRRVLNYDMISVLYVDYGIIYKVKLKDMRLLHKRFLYSPAQAIPARMWGVKDLAGKEVEARKRLVQHIRDAVRKKNGKKSDIVTLAFDPSPP